MSDRAIIITLYSLAALMLVFAVLFAFGRPWSAENSSAVGSGADVAQGETSASDPGSPLAISIPGCVCHSDDPELVEEHSEYRMNQCFGCHADGMPEMEQ